MMSGLLYWLVIKPISLLPYPVLYAFSDFFYVILYHLVGYRKKVVRDNLMQSFPQKTRLERTTIEKAFYRHFCDLVLESLKNFSIGENDIRKRFTHRGTEILDRLHSQGKSALLVGGHYGNWELWAVSAPPHFRHKLMAIYKRLSNPFFDKKMRQTRGRFGLELVSTRETATWLKEHQAELFMSVFAIDQSPSNPHKAHWIDFMGQETAALFGTEKYAKEFNLPIVFGHLRKDSRGMYSIDYDLFTENPRDFPHGELTQQLNKILETDIQKDPRYWLWTHKRWKHRRPTD